MSWYFVDPNGGTKGPMSISQLVPLYGTEITDTTYLWDGVNIHQWTELNKVPSLHKQLSNVNNESFINADGLTPDDIEDILDEIDNKQKEYESLHIQNNQSKPNRNIINNNKSIHKSSFNNINNSQIQSPQYNINWREIYLHRQSILNLVEQGDININIQNPSDGMTLLMHSIIIGDYNLCVLIISYGADIFIKDNDGDDALDYALVFQRYKVTQLLLALGYVRKNGNISIEEAINHKNKQAKYMMNQQFGRFKDKIIHFVTKAIKERESFDINLLYFAWYFTVNAQHKRAKSQSYSNNSYFNKRNKKIIKCNPYQDPLQSKLFKIMMKTYWEIISNKSSDSQGWKWLRKHFINVDNLIWFLPHPQKMKKNNKSSKLYNSLNETDEDDSDTSVDTNNSSNHNRNNNNNNNINNNPNQPDNIKEIVSKIVDN
eukprot:241802_1